MTTRRFTYDTQTFRLDGKPMTIRCGELHFMRIPRPYWRDRLRKARAMGLNAVCAYLFWNAHEPQPGEFVFDGQADAAEFVRMAQEEGLWVLLRPGPYVCAEWDLGGLPSWLLRHEDIRLRCMDERYTQAARRYLLRVGQELAGLTVNRGGPILMVQVENEYGAFGNDRRYMQFVRDTIIDAGFDDVPLFTCDWPDERRLRAGAVEGTLKVANFGSGAANAFQVLRAYQPNAPMMCGEFWCGWFDQWGKARNGSDALTFIDDLRWMVENGASFSLYMFHGGTSFGHSAGANTYETFAPTVSSYDYWACLDEAGRPTRKFHAVRELLQPLADQPLPELPAPQPMIEIPPFRPTERAALLEHLPKPIRDVQPRPMEHYGQDYGVIVYRTDITGLPPGELIIRDVHDYAHVRLNGRHLATLDRRLKQDRVRLDDIPMDRAILEIVVDTLGRVNFGPFLADRKGITCHVELTGMTLMDWEVFPFPSDRMLPTLRYTPVQAGSAEPVGPAFYRATVELTEVGDTFLDMRAWGKGMVWVNGHNLGRFWSIGPQQTLFCPGCWLRSGQNEIVIFDMDAAEPQPIAGLRDPILNEPRDA